MRILFLTGREISYPRNDVIFRCLQRFAVVERIVVDKKPDSLIVNSIIILFRAFPKLLFGAYDLVFVGFYGHLIMLLISILSRKPILFDAFVSTYDTLISDRKAYTASSPIAKLALWLDFQACRHAHFILLDTPQQVVYFQRMFNLPSGRISSIPVGCNESLFYPREVTSTHTQTMVVYYSSYLPVHGVEVVIRAADILKHEAIHFRLIGNGLSYESVRQLARSLDLQNIDFLPILPLESLPDEIANADICLGGHFGLSDKAGRVIPGKIYQILAMAQPLIATATPANLSLLTHLDTAYLCQSGNPASLAEAINTLHQDPLLRERLAKNGRNLYENRCSEKIIEGKLSEIITRMLA
jgi:glycosyltransferase involved in cell wall biosynthesis